MGWGMSQNFIFILQSSSKPVSIRGRIHLSKCSHSPLSHYDDDGDGEEKKREWAGKRKEGYMKGIKEKAKEGL